MKTYVIGLPTWFQSPRGSDKVAGRVAARFHMDKAPYIAVVQVCHFVQKGEVLPALSLQTDAPSGVLRDIIRKEELEVLHEF